MSKERKFDLQDRLIDYAVRIINLSEALPNTKVGKHVSSQMLRSGTSPAPNYGEAQSAESPVAILFTSIETAKKNRDKQGVFTRILDLSVGYWMLKIGGCGNSIVTH